MATDTSTTLTKFESDKTILTATIANSWFGGLYGSYEGRNKSSTDPLVAGHVHDGLHQDGHAQKINLESHVTGQLKNVNIANSAITDRTVAGFTAQEQAIPEFEYIDGTKYYKLDLSSVYSSMPYTFKTIALSAGSGTLSGDGAGSIIADSTTDTLSLVAGTGIDIETDLVGDEITISSTFTESNSFSTITVATSGSETGLASGTSPVVADSTSDTLNIEAGHGIEIVSSAITDTIKFRNFYSVYKEKVTPIEVYGPGWGSISTATIGTTPNDDFNYKFLQVNDNANGVTFHSSIPENVYASRPTSVKVIGYFIAIENGSGYLSGNTTPFSMQLRYGSNSSQNDTGEIDEAGTIPDGGSVLAGARQLWTTGETIAIANVSDTNNLVMVEWTAKELQSNQNTQGILQFKIVGTTGFANTEPFDGDVTRAELHFIGADVLWYY